MLNRRQKKSQGHVETLRLRPADRKDAAKSYLKVSLNEEESRIR